jgi:hypothetical protein
MNLLLASAAFACPTIATGQGSSLSFDVAQVAIVREGTQTTFSVSVNPFGDPQEFALVLPVPEVLAEDQVKTLDGTIFAALDGYTAPRHVNDAGCGGYYYGYYDDGLCGESYDYAAMDSGSTGTSSTVDIEAEYLVGEYQITILSAEESGSLQTWLDDHGYALPDGADAILAEYIDGGSYFLAAKVAKTSQEADGTPLSPLQIRYESDPFYIPIRLATLNSPGEQDMVIYAISSSSEGQVGIANYPEITVPDGCVWGGGSDDFTSAYDALFTEAWSASTEAGWAVEFAGGPYSCNPCTSVWPTKEQVAELGFTGSYDDHFMTRIHMRYTPQQAEEELTLYTSGITDSVVQAYADDLEQNYECIPTFCDGTATPYEEPEEPAEDTAADCGSDKDELLGDCGCGTGTPASLAAVAAGLVLATRRRR